MSAHRVEHGFQPDEIDHFRRAGYVIVRGLAPEAAQQRMLEVARAQLATPQAPLEYEADVRYPGAPASHDAAGGRTVRRLLRAYDRDPVFRAWATSPVLEQYLRQLLGSRVALSQAHHNCIMTKDPRYSSLTHWHRDIRYWAFERPELTSVWLALGSERAENGCLHVLPGSHSMDVRPEQLDDAQFLLDDLEENRAILATQLAVELEPGDVLFFDARLFHAAGHNRTGETKLSVVFTYHATDNRALTGTRSASIADVLL
jgi:phytanoyl-CoA hydroxylase